ncbi:MAG TPA: tRNA (adenosine(37)-N6)-threonylcarbamoyltransferase complex ATPase subunit type 1 TsaE [Bryobacteraceae bacterium]|nr:tRNA (adenosine(37)-N6)-threonylcarbamoyltransferase complex ATPase subunit type 1 TsaE [Bryobacteraceae bacterium]
MSETRTWHTDSPEATAAAAREIASWIPPGVTVQLTGNLGAGKTTLTKSLVEAWGAALADEVASPTFTLIHEYGEPVSVYHIDLYRLEKPGEFYSLGLDEIFDSNARVLIEWGEKFAPLLPASRWIVEIRHAGGDSREITVSRP